MFAKDRLDGLVDPVFGVAMTLLVIDLRLSESLHPHDSAELLKGISDLSTQSSPTPSVSTCSRGDG